MSKELINEFNVACCLCVRNCGRFLPKIFNNLNRLSNLFKNCYFIFIYDNCRDNSEALLKQFQKTNPENIIVKNIENTSPCRTRRIAKARNTCLNIIYNDLKNIDFHIMIDADNVNTKPWNLNYITKYLKNNNWDSLSFNRKIYYDIWALMYGNITHHCWGYNNINICWKIVKIMRSDIINKLNNLKDGELFKCYSAFNGFAIYRTHKFKNIIYDGTYEKFKKLISDKDRLNTLNMFKKILNNPDLKFADKCILELKDGEHCEHLYFHISAIINNNAKIRIAKEIL